MPLRQNSADVAGTNADTNPEKITEAWNEKFGVREKGLEIMLGEVYGEIIEPQIRPSSPRSVTDAAFVAAKKTLKFARTELEKDTVVESTD